MCVLDNTTGDPRAEVAAISTALMAGMRRPMVDHCARMTAGTGGGRGRANHIQAYYRFIRMHDVDEPTIRPGPECEDVGATSKSRRGRMSMGQRKT